MYTYVLYCITPRQKACIQTSESLNDAIRHDSPHGDTLICLFVNLCTPTSLEVRLGSLASRSDGDYTKIKENCVVFRSETLKFLGLILCTPTSLEVRLNSLSSRSDSDYIRIEENFMLLSEMKYSN